MKKNIFSLLLLFFVSVLTAQTTNVHDLIQSALSKDSTENYSAALKDLDKAIEMSKHHNDTAIWLHSKISLENNDVKTASNDIDEVIKHNHNYAEAYFIRGMIKAKTENFEGAIKDFSKVIELNPTSFKAYYNRGLAHALMDEIKQAMQDFSRSIELNPKYAKAYFNRGYWKDIMGDVEGSLTDLLKAKELDPADKEIYLELAVVYARNKKMKEACQELENAAAAGHSISDELKAEFCK